MPKGAIKPVRRAYGGAWSKMAKVELSPALLKRLGEVLVASVVGEAKKDFAKQGMKPTGRGKPEGIPDSDNFFKSFSYKIVGQKTVELVSTWPWVEQIIEGRDPYPMDWLTRDSGRYRVPILQSDGKVLYRMAPLSRGDAWIHPGFARHTFLARGIRKGRKEMARMVAKEAMAQLMAGDISR